MSQIYHIVGGYNYIPPTAKSGQGSGDESPYSTNTVGEYAPSDLEASSGQNFVKIVLIYNNHIQHTDLLLNYCAADI